MRGGHVCRDEAPIRAPTTTAAKTRRKILHKKGGAKEKSRNFEKPRASAPHDDGKPEFRNRNERYEKPTAPKRVAKFGKKGRKEKFREILKNHMGARHNNAKSEFRNRNEQHKKNRGPK